MIRLSLFALENLLSKNCLTINDIIKKKHKFVLQMDICIWRNNYCYDNESTVTTFSEKFMFHIILAKLKLYKKCLVEFFYKNCLVDFI